MEKKSMGGQDIDKVGKNRTGQNRENEGWRLCAVKVQRWWITRRHNGRPVEKFTENGKAKGQGVCESVSRIGQNRGKGWGCERRAIQKSLGVSAVCGFWDQLVRTSFWKDVPVSREGGQGGLGEAPRKKNMGLCRYGNTKKASRDTGGKDVHTW